MGLLAAMVIAAASARVEAVYLTTVDLVLAVRVTMSGRPGMVAVRREGAAARLSIMDASLGLHFAGGRRFAWTPSDGFDTALFAASPAKLDRLEIAATDSEVSVLLRVPPEVTVDMRRDARGVLLVLRTAPAEPPETVRQPEPAPAIGAPVPAPVPTLVTTTPPAAPAEAVDLAKRLFPTAPAEGRAAGTVAELYPQLFPTGAPQSQREAAEPVLETPEPGEDAGAVLGPFRVRTSVDARYVDADTFAGATAEPTRDNYLEVQPRVQAATPVGEGAFRLEYAPVFRAFASYDEVSSSSHQLGAGLELPIGSRVTLKARDRFLNGVLDTRVVDPGGEYFFDLGRFNRNDLDVGASVGVGPRLSVEVGGALGYLHFVEDSSFFDYDTELVSAGLGYELTSNLRATALYVFDRVPPSDERLEAESTAHNARLSLTGEILPLLTGELAVGYRSQDSPNAGPGGTNYSGLTFQTSLQRDLGREASVSLYANRSTPLSAFEQNAFYVSTGVRSVLEVPLAARFELRGGVGYQWNDYRTIAEEIGGPREDRILSWFAGLRRPVAHRLALSAAYRKEERSSNIDSFDTDAEGFYLQLEWDIVGTSRR